MKNLVLLLAAVAVFGCKSKETREMPGVYNMLSQSLNDGQKDSTIVGIRQLKIYTPDHMMYTSLDSTEDVTNPLFHLDIKSTPVGYKQVITGIELGGKKFTLREEYESVGESKTSPLDGAWEIARSYIIIGPDTTL